MRLGEVVANAARLVRGSPETEIARVVYHSAQAGQGTLFCALGGTRHDGTAFIADAVARGASAVLAAREVPGDFPLAVAEDPRRAMALAAAAIHRFPSTRLTTLAVTGTNGKTTVATLAEQMAAAAGRRTGLIGTVEQRIRGEARPATHTTPESVDLQNLLAEMVHSGVEIVAMEVSSHALAQSRVAGMRFRAAAFTQLSRDHLDYHGDMESYFQAKAQLFREHLAPESVAILPADDPWAERLAAMLPPGPRVWRYGIGESAGGPLDIGMRELALGVDGFSGILETPRGARPVRSRLVGRYNVSNALAATGLALAAGIPLGAIVEALERTRGAPGRLEPVDDPAGRRVFVDYAHTDDALARVLDALRSLAPVEARLICAFGCGGDRDRGKRPLMGRAAAERADVVVVTSDNPRTEDPSSIIDDVRPGLVEAGLAHSDERALSAGGRGWISVVDRAEAIASAISFARPGDVVLIAGKGHETYQEVNGVRRPFDDRQVARGVVAGLGSRA